MPTLHWIGKDKVQNHHLDVPLHILENKYRFPDKISETDGATVTLVQGDNLLALKALIPKYEGKVKCIYIDPPYNTGNKGWVYNDAVNDPKIKRWLGQVVGKEAEDLSRYDKWLCMMYPKFKLLHKLLAEDGVIFVSIDENEQAQLKLVMDEIFGRNKLVSQFIWKSRVSEDARAKTGVSNDHEHILTYFKSEITPLMGMAKDLSKFSNPDNDIGGSWRSTDLTGLASITQRPNLHFPILDPESGLEFPPPSKGRRFERKTMDRKIEERRILFTQSIEGRPRQKVFVDEMASTNKSISSVILETNTGQGTKLINEIFGSSEFDFPKPVNLVELLINQVANQDSIILDSFAGSGATAHAVLNLNKKDGGNRKCLLVEMEDYAERITAERVKRVIAGYGTSPILPEEAFPNLPEQAPPNLPEGEALTAARSPDKKPGRWVEGTGGSFQFSTLGPRLFHEDGNLNEVVPLEEIRNYVWWSETRLSLLKVEGSETCSPSGRAGGEAFLGVHQETDYYFYYEKERVTTLDEAFLSQIGHKANQYVVYADELVLSQNRLRQLGITFKKIPEDIQLM